MDSNVRSRVTKSPAFLEEWAVFLASERQDSLNRIARRLKGRCTHFRIREVIRVVGEPPTKLRKGWRVLRIESKEPLRVAEVSKIAKGPMVTYIGVTRPSQYTRETQRKELDSHSRGELEPSGDTIAVLIPIGKSARWWKLGKDVRETFFRKTQAYQGHTAIGLEYVDRVYRKLYHSRHTASSLPYDFLTYFEFQSIHEDDFRLLLVELRDTDRNPEWAYVELDFEIWMTKLG